MASEPFKMMLGFVVRRCAAELGHEPTASELADWANNQRDARGDYRIFGRPISPGEAHVILRHPKHLVAINGTRVGDIPAAATAPTNGKVVSLDLRRSRRLR